MSTVKAYYDGITFFPIEALNIPGGKVVNLTINEEETPSPETARKLAKLAYINSNLEKLNESEPLSPEFDKIMSQRINFARVLLTKPILNVFLALFFVVCPFQLFMLYYRC